MPIRQLRTGNAYFTVDFSASPWRGEIPSAFVETILSPRNTPDTELLNQALKKSARYWGQMNNKDPRQVAVIMHQTKKLNGVFEGRKHPLYPKYQARHDEAERDAIDRNHR